MAGIAVAAVAAVGTAAAALIVLLTGHPGTWTVARIAGVQSAGVAHAAGVDGAPGLYRDVGCRDLKFHSLFIMGRRDI